jgi:NTE family protein
MLRHLIRALRGCLVCLAVLVSACASRNITEKPLSTWTPELNRRAAERIVGDRSQEMLVLVAFSGGGTRAAAFAYGVLQELAATEVTTGKGSRKLLQEIDVISSVSGGSFTSAYYGLYGERIFEDFEERFLRKDVDGHLALQLGKPNNWFRLMGGAFGRSDLAAEYYSKHIFDGATFTDLHRPNAPVVVINATDLATGMRFTFTQSYFDLICADLTSYPVSRAVASSSAVPGIFSPITLKNYGGSCGFEPPPWLGEALKEDTVTSRKMEARGLEDYHDREKRPWLHLVDGGIADNLGLRSFYDTVSLVGDPRAAFRELRHPDVRRILIISVNAHARHSREWALKRKSPSLLEVLGSVSGDQINRYSLDTIDIVRTAYQRWTEQISTPERPVTFQFVEVSFDAVEDDAERRQLNKIGTNFALKDEQVDLLISSGRKLLRGSSEFQAFLAGTQGRGE